MTVTHGHQTGELIVRLCRSAYTLTFAQARDLAEKLIGLAGAPDRDPAPADLVERVKRLEGLVLADSDARLKLAHAISAPVGSSRPWALPEIAGFIERASAAIDAEAELIRLDRSGL